MTLDSFDIIKEGAPVPLNKGVTLKWIGFTTEEVSQISSTRAPPTRVAILVTNLMPTHAGTPHLLFFVPLGSRNLRFPRRPAYSGPLQTANSRPLGPFTGYEYPSATRGKG